MQTQESINLWRWIFFGIVALFTCWIVLPYPHLIYFPGITIPEEQQVVYVPFPGTVEKIYVQREQIVKKGEPLISLSSLPLQSNIAMKEKEKEIIEAEIDILSIDRPQEMTLSELPAKNRELLRIIEALKGDKAAYKQLQLEAQIDGQVIDWNNSLWVGEPVQKNKILGKIVNLKKIKVQGYIPGKYVDDIQEGASISFILSGSLERVSGTITSINPIAAEHLDYPQLGSPSGGPLPVQLQPDGSLLVLESYFGIEVSLDEPPRPLLIGERGYIEARGPWTSYLYNAFLRLFKTQVAPTS